MQLVDTHCHLCHGRLHPHAPEVLDRARQAGVILVVVAAANLEESAGALQLARRFDGVRCLAGLHPHEAASAAPGYLDRITQLSQDPLNVAIGEIGLDYHYDFSPRDVQQRVFAEQLALAGRLRKRVVVHTREAFDDTLAILAESGLDGGEIIFHSFTGGPDEARRALAIGAALSFSGIATFRNADDIRQAVRLCPPDRLLIETDAPYLSPEPVRRQKTNEPAHVAHVATHLADLLGMTPDAFAERTTANARRLFALP